MELIACKRVGSCLALEPIGVRFKRFYNQFENNLNTQKEEHHSFHAQSQVARHQRSMPHLTFSSSPIQSDHITGSDLKTGASQYRRVL